MGHSVRPPDLQKRHVAFQINSLFPIILLGFRLHYRQNVGMHLEAAQPGHIKANVQAHVYEKLHARQSTSRGGTFHRDAARMQVSWGLKSTVCSPRSQNQKRLRYQPYVNHKLGNGGGGEGQIREIKELLHFRPKQHSLPVEKLGGSQKRA